MAAPAVRAELRLADGQRHTVSVAVRTDLPSLIRGLDELSRTASRLLSDLVEREKASGGGAPGEGEAANPCIIRSFDIQLRIKKKTLKNESFFLFLFLK
uniref:Uncharacterized protein n=1 Tax=Salarias fasciatus TaxID=181472 RepID=A0A672HJ36_SALFA